MQIKLSLIFGKSFEMSRIVEKVHKKKVWPIKRVGTKQVIKSYAKTSN
jgi:hypothetical protein